MLDRGTQTRLTFLRRTFGERSYTYDGDTWGEDAERSIRVTIDPSTWIIEADVLDPNALTRGADVFASAIRGAYESAEAARSAMNAREKRFTPLQLEDGAKLLEGRRSLKVPIITTGGPTSIPDEAVLSPGGGEPWHPSQRQATGTSSDRGISLTGNLYRGLTQVDVRQAWIDRTEPINFRYAVREAVSDLRNKGESL